MAEKSYLSMDQATAKLHALLTEQIRKLLTQGWPAQVILRATEMAYITMMVSIAVRMDDGLRVNWLHEKKRAICSEIDAEVTAAILRESAKSETMQ